jgi:hypothetical protein
MREYLALRVSEMLGQGELISLLESRFPSATKPIGKKLVEGTKCVETRVPTDSPEFQEIAAFIRSKRAQGHKAFEFFPIASYLRKYTKNELRAAELLTLDISDPYWVEHHPPGGSPSSAR